MPAIVIGADTDIGRAVVTALLNRQGEVRAFVSQAPVGAELKKLGVKVALGDVSDASHIGPAARNAFSAILIAEAAADERERSFATDPQAVFAVWAEALMDAGVKRIIWVGPSRAPKKLTTMETEFFAVATRERDPAEIGREVAKLDDAAQATA